MTERKVKLTRTTAMWGKGTQEPAEITVSSLEDLEALSVKYDADLILTVGTSGMLEGIEIYDDYRE